ncbi:hypothetical protein CCHOA_09775 [Corynebacterium choanae]|uniref:Uncharacterized protein n=1 Tax=Corynebacterium choanae TaxID=1862358 RepID=A0A3G6JBA1_9CORY|nr:hypothetical protein CCHOA_09775 [Corynebacterium choanae]
MFHIPMHGYTPISLGVSSVIAGPIPHNMATPTIRSDTRQQPLAATARKADREMDSSATRRCTHSIPR